MNILRSFTETVVTTPTELFPISFEYDEKYDAVHVFLNDVAVEDLGYTVSQVNAVTLKVEPAIPDGTVRIERETDIDKMKYIFDAGALFIDQNVDADFRQIVHSQQEVRDGFIKLRGDVLPLVHGLQEALQQAQEASEAAQEAAEAAEAAAQFVQSVSDYTVLPFVTGKVYGINRRVQLDNGYIVKSTIPNNVNNPNNNMTGWVFDSELLLESFGATEGADATLAIQKAFAYIRSIGGGSIKTNLRSITVSDVCIYHDNTIFDFNKCKVEFVGSGKIVGAIYNADKTAFVGAGEAEIYYKAAKTRAIQNPNARITSNAPRKSQSITVDNAAGFVVGDFIFVSNGYCDMWRVMEQYESTGLPVNRSFQDWVRPDVDLWRCEIVKIKSITGNTIVLEDQLENGYMAVPKTYGFFSDENSRSDAIGWNYPTIEKLNGASNCTFKNIEAVNNGATHSIVSYLGVNNNILDSVGYGTGQAFEFQTCYNSHMLRNYTCSEKIGQSIRRGSSMCIMSNATAHYRSYDATLLIWEGSNLCVANNIIVEGTGGNVSHAKIGFYFNTAWNCTGTNIQGKNVQTVVDTSFCRGGIFVDGITGVNCDSLIGSYASFDVKATNGLKKGAYKDSISEYDASLFYVSESNDIDFRGLKDSTKYSDSKTNGRAHIYKSFALNIKDIDAENVVLWNSVDDSKVFEPSKYKIKVSGSVFKSMFLTQTYDDGEAQTRRSYIKDTDFMQFVAISNTHNTEFKGVKILGRDVAKSLILNTSHFTRLIDCEIYNNTVAIDFKGIGSAHTENWTSLVYMRDTVVDAPTKFLNYVDTSYMLSINAISSKSKGLKYLSVLTDYPKVKTYANPAGDGNVVGWFMVDNTKNQIIESYTTSEIQSATSMINTFENKWLGREIYNTTISKFMRANGSGPTAQWVSSDGVNTITPA